MLKQSMVNSPESAEADRQSGCVFFSFFLLTYYFYKLISIFYYSPGILLAIHTTRIRLILLSHLRRWRMLRFLRDCLLTRCFLLFIINKEVINSISPQSNLRSIPGGFIRSTWRGFNDMKSRRLRQTITKKAHMCTSITKVVGVSASNPSSSSSLHTSRTNCPLEGLHKMYNLCFI